MTTGRFNVAAIVMVATVGMTGTRLGAQTPFEGAVTIRMTMKSQQGTLNQQVEYLTRAGKVRVNMAAPPGMPVAGPSLIVVPQEKKMYMLLTAQSAYMEMPFSDSTAAAVTRGAPVTDDTKLVRTGRMETIAGLSCEHVQVTSKMGSADMCLSKELGRFVNPTDGMRQGGGGAWQREVGNEFPLRVTMPDGSVPLEVTKVERKRLSNDLFTVPGTFNKMTMPAGRPPAGRPPAA